jgi:hypothetical protein
MKTTLVQPEHNVSFDHQRQLAKLLAKENIRVHQGNYKTAFFDVKKRVLGLPAWNLDSKDVSDLLVGHEVGHARWTPSAGIEQYHERFGKEAPFDICNIVEDIRIERLILAAFPGLVSSFTKGYTHLLENDFFKLKDRNINELNFIDRLNIKGKLRHLVVVEFDEWETEIYTKCLRAETFEEVLDICEEIIDNLPKEETQQENPEEPSQPGQDSEEEGGDDDLDSNIRGNDADPSMNEDNGDGSDSISDPDQNEDGEDDTGQTSKADEKSDEDDGDERSTSSSNANEAGDANPDFSSAISETQRAFEEELENSQKDFGNAYYVNAPSRKQIDECISSLDTVREARRSSSQTRYDNLMACSVEDSRWTEFKNDSKKNVALLVREFERKKSAYEYSRAQTSATGSIDPNKLHSYKYDDQIFKSVTRLATSKNHGMVFFIDWSGSMNSVLHDVIQQTLQLAFFCKAVGIPFAVYGFTSQSGRRWNNASVDGIEDQVGKVVDLSGASVFELLNSTINKNEFEVACKELFVGTRGFCNNFCSDIEQLGGTPLFDTIICAAEIVNRFRAQHNVQKLHTMFLTDGESQSLRYARDPETEVHEKPAKAPDETENHYGYKQRDEYLSWGNTQIGPRAFTHGYGTVGGKIYRDLILNFKKITGSSAICFFLGGPRDAKSAAINAISHSSKFNSTTWHTAAEDYKILRKKSLKDKSRTLFVEDGLGYDGYFVIESSNVGIEDTELEVDKNLDYSKAADVNRLARQFSTQNRNKRASRVFLTKFSDLIS